MREYKIVNDNQDVIPYHYYEHNGEGTAIGTVIVVHGGAFVAGHIKSLRHVCTALNNNGFDAIAVTYTLSVIDCNILRYTIVSLSVIASALACITSTRVSITILIVALFLVVLLTVLLLQLDDHDRYKHPRHVRDVSQTLAHIVSNQNICTNNLHIIGHSAGAYIVALLAADKQYLADVGVSKHSIQTYICLSGVYSRDAIPLQRLMLRSIFEMTQDEDVDSAMPITHIHKGMQPMLLINCSGDIFLNQHALNFHEDMKANNNECKLIYTDSRHHCNIHHDLETVNSDVLDEMILFLDVHSTNKIQDSNT